MSEKNALISVYDKEGVVSFARGLVEQGYTIYSTGGTARLLEKNNVSVIQVSEYTSHKEILGGRVKTLHPKIFGGILVDHDNDDHVSELKRESIVSFSVIAVNLYPLEEKVVSQSALGDIIESIDIGGHSLIRASSKNFKHVLLVSDPDDYDTVLQDLRDGNNDEAYRARFASKSLLYVARYDTILSRYFSDNFSDDVFPEIFNFTYSKIQDLRHGENPHQQAAFYKSFFVNEACVSTASRLQGKTLSYNNILDANDAFELVKDFKEPCAAVIKHTNPSGVSIASTIDAAFAKAHEADPLSAFGSIVALNKSCTREVAQLLKPLFVEVVICPHVEDDAREILLGKKKLRILETGAITDDIHGFHVRSVTGGLLVQTREFPNVSKDDLKVVTKRVPTEDEIRDMLFGFRVTRHAKSNCIVFARDNVTTGIGAGQMSRVDAVKLAVVKSDGKCKGSVMSSDAFFPFRDGIDVAAKAGITAIIQPGGSVRDQEVIDACNEHGIAMLFTGVRLFKH